MNFILRPNETTALTLLLTWITQRDTEKTWKVSVSEYVKSRTLEQNAYLFGVVYKTLQTKIFESRGEHYSLDDIHEFLAQKFLPKRQITIKGETKNVRISSTKLSTKEFSDYLELVFHFAAESGIVIPEPEWRMK